MYHLFGKKTEGSSNNTPQEEARSMDFKLEDVVQRDNEEIIREAQRIGQEAARMVESVPSIFTILSPNVPTEPKPVQPVPPDLPPREESATPDPVVWPIPDEKVEPVIPDPIPDPVIPDPIPVPPKPPKPWPRPDQKDEVPPRPNPEPPKSEKKCGEGDCVKNLEDFSKFLEGINAGINQKISELEDLVKSRSKQIKDETKFAFDDAIERARKLKEVMHESELKDLELQMKHFELLDKAEEKALERALRMKNGL